MSHPGAEYRIEVRRAAARSLAGIPQRDRERIDAKILALAANPRPPGIEKLTGMELYRIRVGSFRIVFSIDDASRGVTVEVIGDRKDVYRRLR